MKSAVQKTRDSESNAELHTRHVKFIKSMINLNFRSLKGCVEKSPK